MIKIKKLAADWFSREECEVTRKKKVFFVPS